MKTIQIIAYLIFGCWMTILVGCTKQESPMFSENKGYFEYEYKYVLNGVEKKGYKRVILKNAKLKERTKTLPSPHWDKFKEVDMIFYSDKADLNASIPLDGESLIKLFFATEIETVRDTAYVISSQYDLPTNVKTYCFDFFGGANWMNDRGDGFAGFEYTMNPQQEYKVQPAVSLASTSKIYVIKLQGGRVYQVTAQGTCKTHAPSDNYDYKFTLMYTGVIDGQ